MSPAAAEIQKSGRKHRGGDGHAAYSVDRSYAKKGRSGESISSISSPAKLLTDDAGCADKTVAASAY